MNKIEVKFTWFKDLENLYVQNDDGYTIKHYNRITNAGDVGRAIKDFMMEIEENDKQGETD